MNAIPPASVGHADSLLEWIAALRPADLPAAAAHHATRCLADTLACGLYGSRLPWGRIAAAFVRDEGSRGNATLLGDATPMAPARAALANGTMVHGFELDDVILGSLSHPGTVVIPAALAVTEHMDAPTERLLLGIIAGYEVTARLGEALGEHCADLGFHPTGIVGAISATVAACTVLELPLDTMRQAVGIAASCGSGIKAFAQGNGGMVKRFHGGRAAEAGVVATLMAYRGFSGPRQALDGRFGVLPVFGGPTARPSVLSENLGAGWAINRSWIKVYPFCGVLHTAAQAVEMLCAREALTPDLVAAIRIGTSRRGVEQHSERAPTDSMQAQYSLPFCAGLALNGLARDAEAFATENLAQSKAMADIPKVEMHVDPEIHAAYPGKFAARVEIEQVSGTRHSMTVWDAHGMPADPCTDDELNAKFISLCTPVCGKANAATLLSAIHGLASGGAVRAVSKALKDAAGSGNWTGV